MFNMVSQEIIIKNLNSYFKSQNLPWTFDEEGICNGLSYVYAQYVLEGREDKFNAILQTIAGNKLVDSVESADIDVFAFQVLLSFIPEMFDKELSQATSIHALGKPVESGFQIGMVLDDSAWETVLNDINLQDNEVMMINSTNHTIAISKQNGKYKVYDPNYRFGFNLLDNEQKLVHELHNNVFCYSSKSLAMRINIVKNISVNTPAPKREQLSFYERYLTNVNILDLAEIETKKISSLSIAIDCNDDKSIRYLMSIGAKIEPNVLGKAIIRNHANVIQQLFTDESITDSTINSCLLCSLNKGRLEAFNALLNNNRCAAIFNERFITTNKVSLIAEAAKGGNIDLLKNILKLCHQDKTKYQDFSTSMNRFDNYKLAMKNVVLSGNAECVKLLISEFEAHDVEIDDATKMNCLMAAIKLNQPLVVTTLIAEIPPRDLNKITMKLGFVDKTNLSILKQLQRQGVKFSDKAQAIIEKKEQRSVGLLLNIGIVIEKFMDYLLRTQDITVKKMDYSDISAKYKDSVSDIKNDDLGESKVVGFKI